MANSAATREDTEAPSRMMSSDFDVAVVGAGPAGSATARWLALRGQRVALLERSRFDVPRVGESLAPAVQPLLVELGVWRQFLALKPLPSYGTRSHWGEATPRMHSHLLSPWGCGWHVDRRAFDLMLAQAACVCRLMLLSPSTTIWNTSAASRSLMYRSDAVSTCTAI